MNTDRPDLTLIAAMARNRVIGRDNDLAWHLPEDLAHFKQHTLGAAVIMGRKTWESLPERFRPLPGRRNIVLSRDPGYHAPGAEVFGALDAAVARLAAGEPAFVIGGAQIYARALPCASRLLLTEIDADFPGDAHFPEWSSDDFVEVSRESHQARPPNVFRFSFVTYRRTTPRSI